MRINIGLFILSLFLKLFALEYSYNDNRQLVNIIHSDSTVETFTYDILGNRTDHTISIPQYKISLSTIGNGFTTPSGTATFSTGDTLSVTASPNTGSHFGYWSVSGGITVVDSSASGRFRVSGTGTIQANFLINQYTVTIEANGTGSTTPSGDTTVNYGSDIPVVAIPSTGYHFEAWVASTGLSIDDTTQASATVTNVASNGTVTAQFAINQYNVEISASSGGTVAPSGELLLDYHGSVSVQATPSAGYHFLRWETTGSLSIDSPANSSASIEGIESDGTVKALFGRDTLPGAISVDSISATTEVYMYATNSWIGKKALTGQGTVQGLATGTYRICMLDTNKRQFYTTIEVKEDDTAHVHETLGNKVPLLFSVKEQLKKDNGDSLQLNMPICAALDDIDADGSEELIVAEQDGAIQIYENNSGFVLSHTFTTTIAGAVTCIRIVDFESDNTPKIVLGLNTGDIFSINPDGTNKKNIYNASSGLTGFDFCDLNRDEQPDIVLGYSDGTMKLVLSTGTLTWSSSTDVVTPDNTVITAGTGAVPLLIEISGDNHDDIVCGNNSWDVVWFQNNGSNKFIPQGPVNSGGEALQFDSTCSLAAVYKNGKGLPGAVLTDDLGRIFTIRSVLNGDINNDGIVDVLDLQQMGVYWGMNNSNSGWDGKVNLHLTTGPTQTINILDLQALAKHWGRKQ